MRANIRTLDNTNQIWLPTENTRKAKNSEGTPVWWKLKLHTDYSKQMPWNGLLRTDGRATEAA